MKILAWDLETSPHLVWTFGLRNQNIGINQIKEPSRVLCHAARWMDEPKRNTHFDAEWIDGREEMAFSIWSLLDEADALVSWNGPGFDTRQINRVFKEFGLAEPSPFVEIDLLRTARKRFYFASNKLDWVARELGVGEKLIHEGMPLWIKVMEEDRQAQKKFQRYNEQDVHLLVDLYRELLPWIPNHPNVNLFDGTDGHCPKGCGDTLQKRGFRSTSTGLYQKYVCTKCGSWSTSGKAAQRSDIRSLS
jgi:hypothetical protein